MEEIPRKYGLREATEEDLPFLFDASTEAMRPITDELEPEKVRDRERDFDHFKNKYNLDETKVITQGDENAGRLRVARSKEGIYIGALHLLPEFQNQGIGTGILQDLIRESDESGIPLVLEVHKINTKAFALYESLGFKTTSETEKQFVMKYTPKA